LKKDKYIKLIQCKFNSVDRERLKFESQTPHLFTLKVNF